MKVHLGCGPQVFQGWYNLDLDPKHPSVLKHDLTKPLPFTESFAAYIYSEHFIEHITKSQGLNFLKECYRILQSGGVLRLSTPDLTILAKDYLEGKIDRWSNAGWKPASACDLLNEGMRSWGHQYLYGQEEITKSLKLAGFQQEEIKMVPWRLSKHNVFNGIETRTNGQELILEATK